MAECVFAIPGDLGLPTGGYAYDRRVMALLPQHGVAVRHLALPASFPAPSAEDLEETARLLAAVPGSAVLLIDGLAYGAMSVDVLARVEAPIVALVHHPLGHEAGLPEARRAELIASERIALGFARAVVVTSEATARSLVAEFGVDPAILAVAEPGTDPAPRARGTGDPPQLLAVGAIVPRKGHDVLVAALATLADLPWDLTIVGAADRAPDTAMALERQIAAAGLGERVRLVGALDDAGLAQAYDTADIFVLSSLYEGYGMVLAEAMARGLPIVATTGGAAAETLPDAAGLKVPPGDAGALADALRRVLVDGDLRRRLADAAFAAGQSLPRWDDTAIQIAAVIKEVSK